MNLLLLVNLQMQFVLIVYTHQHFKSINYRITNVYTGSPRLTAEGSVPGRAPLTEIWR